MIKTSIKILINTDSANNIVPPQRKSRRKNIDFQGKSGYTVERNFVYKIQGEYNG